LRTIVEREASLACYCEVLAGGGLGDELDWDIHTVCGRNGDMRPTKKAGIPRPLFNEGYCIDPLKTKGGIGEGGVTSPLEHFVADDAGTGAFSSEDTPSPSPSFPPFSFLDLVLKEQIFLSHFIVRNQQPIPLLGPQQTRNRCHH